MAEISKNSERILKRYSQEVNISYSNLRSKFLRLTSSRKGGLLNKIRKDLTNIKKENKKESSKPKERKLSEIWYKNVLKRAKSAGKTKIEKGFFYHFTYRSDYFPDLLSYYDTKPLVYVFDTPKKYILGINFHWQNPTSRFELINKMKNLSPDSFDVDERNLKVGNIGHFIDGTNFKIKEIRDDGNFVLLVYGEEDVVLTKKKFLKISYFGKVQKNNPINLTYNNIKNMAGFKKAYVIIRKYIRNNISKKILRLNNNEIENIIALPSHKFVGISAENAWLLSKAKAQYTKEIKGKKKKGTEEYKKWKKDLRKRLLGRF